MCMTPGNKPKKLCDFLSNMFLREYHILGRKSCAPQARCLWSHMAKKLATRWYVAYLTGKKTEGVGKICKANPTRGTLVLSMCIPFIDQLSRNILGSISHLWIMLTQPTSNKSQLSNKSNNNTCAMNPWYKLSRTCLLGIYHEHTQQ